MVKLLLKKSYQINNLKETKFKDLWGSSGVFTTMRLVGKPGKLILYKNHIKNLIKNNLSNKIKYNHLLRIALTKKLISLSIRERPRPRSNFELKILNYKRKDPKYKNLYYKYILKKLNAYDTKKVDILLVYENKILETCTSNLLFVKNNKYYSPKNNCYIGNTINFLKKKIRITFKDIKLKDINQFDEILLIGSGKGVTPVRFINKYKWKNKDMIGFKKVNQYFKLLHS